MSLGGQMAVDDLVALHYDELQVLARRRLRRDAAAEVLQAAGLVSEAYLRLVSRADIDARDKSHFFALMSVTMRHVLVDLARRRRRQKRGAGAELIALDEMTVSHCAEPERDELVALDHALVRLQRNHPRWSAVVTHRVFLGLTLEETAVVLGVSTKTVQRDWRDALEWLRQEVAKDLDLAI